MERNYTRRKFTAICCGCGQSFHTFRPYLRIKGEYFHCDSLECFKTYYELKKIITKNDLFNPVSKVTPKYYNIPRSNILIDDTSLMKNIKKSIH